MAEKNAHCSYCGEAFAVDAQYPRACASCKKELGFPLHTRVLADFFARSK